MLKKIFRGKSTKKKKVEDVIEETIYWDNRVLDQDDVSNVDEEQNLIDAVHEAGKKIEPIFPSDIPSTTSNEIVIENDCSKADILKWHRERPSPGPKCYREYREAMRPLVPPILLGQFTDSTPITLPKPVDYLISWCDHQTCCGFIKNVEDATENVPLVMRFGGYWTDCAILSMFVGCTVRATAYLKVKALKQGAQWNPLVPLGSDIRTFLFAGTPYPSAFAWEWAVVSKPNIVRSLGIIKEDHSYETEEFRHLRAVIQDCEYGEELFACPEKWPLPDIREVPPPGTAVAINYVEITEPHTLFHSRDKILLFPNYMVEYAKTTDILDKTYLFGWIDLTMQPSRCYL
ncbi:unnamed protein product [Bursaphelenchus xylophilus]|uniref:(pine wood nematode) hypothetical protein n=1 Tax=Bursaphelenchus xylophilus TaxID=6326 RepID=A0A1I7RWR7_BURXY|nr:unnamed protein product [Bursaphelenchus xylophilus]CAG9128612.1 unnamed protein product [Bursaphelenchus xylophilus]